VRHFRKFKNDGYHDAWMYCLVDKDVNRHCRLLSVLCTALLKQYSGCPGRKLWGLLWECGRVAMR
jgi:hypothetical protein